MRRTKNFLILGLIIFWTTCVGAEENFLEKVTAEFNRVVENRLSVSDNYTTFVETDAVRFIKTLPALEQKTQVLFYTDRNPGKQIGAVVFYDNATQRAHLVGAEKISTGDPKRKKHFETPVGIFANTTQNIGYRAEGTKNDQGWRGLGAKGCRVWDFGWQETDYQGEKREIRLQMHATDPVYGEKRLGKIDSKGCVRVSARMNYFLDHYSVLDEEYEKTQGRWSWLLKKDRTPIGYIGKYLVVGDSRRM